MSPTDAQTQPQPSSAPSQPSRIPRIIQRLGIIGVTIVNSLTAIIALIVCFFIAPKFQAIFEDFQTTLPALTQFLLNHQILCAILLITPTILVTLFYYSAITSSNTKTITISAALVLINLLFAYIFVPLLIVLALFLPMIKLMQSVM